MAEVVQGGRIIYLYRLLSEQATADAFRLAFVTEDSISYSKDADSTATKDGVIRTPSPVEIEKPVTCLLAKGDTDVKKLKDAMLEDEVIELWEANLDEPVSDSDSNDKFYGTYYQGYITSYEKTSNAEDMVEIQMTIGVNGKGADGEVTVTDDQQEDASYVFVDTEATGDVSA